MKDNWLYSDPRLNKIVESYTYDSQSRMTQEECAELTQAINKMYRHILKYGDLKLEDLDKAQFENTIEYIDILKEMADVKIMIAQMETFLGCRGKVDEYCEEKLDKKMVKMGEFELISSNSTEIYKSMNPEKIEESKPEMPSMPIGFYYKDINLEVIDQIKDIFAYGAYSNNEDVYINHLNGTLRRFGIKSDYEEKHYRTGKAANTLDLEKTTFKWFRRVAEGKESIMLAEGCSRTLEEHIKLIREYNREDDLNIDEEIYKQMPIGTIDMLEYMFITVEARMTPGDRDQTLRQVNDYLHDSGCGVRISYSVIESTAGKRKRDADIVDPNLTTFALFDGPGKRTKSRTIKEHSELIKLYGKRGEEVDSSNKNDRSKTSDELPESFYYRGIGTKIADRIEEIFKPKIYTQYEFVSSMDQVNRLLYDFGAEISYDQRQRIDGKIPENIDLEKCIFRWRRKTESGLIESWYFSKTLKEHIELIRKYEKRGEEEDE